MLLSFTAFCTVMGSLPRYSSRAWSARLSTLLETKILVPTLALGTLKTWATGNNMAKNVGKNMGQYGRTSGKHGNKGGFHIKSCNDRMKSSKHTSRHLTNTKKHYSPSWEQSNSPVKRNVSRYPPAINTAMGLFPLVCLFTRVTRGCIPLCAHCPIYISASSTSFIQVLLVTDLMFMYQMLTKGHISPNPLR